MNQWVLICLGGAIGAGSRMLLLQLLPIMILGFNLSILCVNAIGCFVAGILSSILGPTSEGLRTLLLSGFLGAFTTFSAFALEINEIARFKNIATAGIQLTLSVACSVGACYLGTYLGQKFAE